MPNRELQLSLKIIADAAAAVRQIQGTTSASRELGIEIDRISRRADAFQQLQQAQVTLGTALTASKDRARDLRNQLIAVVDAQDRFRDVQALRNLRAELQQVSRVAGAARDDLAELAQFEAISGRRSPRRTAVEARARQGGALETSLQNQIGPIEERLRGGGIDLGNLAGEENRLRALVSQFQQLSLALNEANKGINLSERELSGLQAEAAKLGSELRAAKVDTVNLSAEQQRLAGDALRAAAAATAEADALRRAQQVTNARTTLGLGAPDGTKQAALQARAALATLRQTGNLTYRDLVDGATAAARASREYARTQLAIPGARAIGGAVGAASSFGASALAGAGLIGGGYGLVQAIQSVRDVTVQFEGYQIALEAVTGSQERANDSIAFTRGLAEDLGLELVRITERYTQFAAATRGTRLEGEAGQVVFEQLASSFAVLGLSQERQSLAFQAFTQILGKGVVQAEELRGQLAESLPGAVEIAARALRITTAELNTLIRTGQVNGTDFIIAFGAQLQQELGDRIPTAAESSRAAFGRFANAITALQLQIGNGGVVTKLTDAIELLTERLKDPAVVQGLTDIGTGVITAFGFIVENADTILKVFAATKGAEAGAAVGTTVGALFGPQGAAIGRAGGAAVGGAAAAIGVDALLDGTGESADRAKPKVKGLDDQIAALTSRYDVLTAKLRNGEVDGGFALPALDRLKAQIDELKTRAPSLDSELQALTTRYTTLSEKLSRGEVSASFANQALQRLQSQIEAARARSPAGAADTEADRLAAEGRIKTATEAAKQISEAGNALTRLRANLDSTAAVASATISAQIALIDEAEKQALITAEEGLRRRAELQAKQVQGEIAIRRAEIAGINNQLAQISAVSTGTDTTERLKQVADLEAARTRTQGQINALKVREAEISRATTAAIDAQARADALRLNELRGALARETQDGAGVRETTRRDLEDRLKKELGSSNPDLRDAARQTVERQVDQAEFDTLRQTAEQTIGSLQAQFSTLQQGVQAGTVTTQQVVTKFGEALRDATPDVEALIEQLRVLAEGLGPEAGQTVTDLANRLQGLSIAAQSPLESLLTNWRDTTGAMQNLTADFANNAADAIADFVTTGKFNIRDLFQTLASELARVGVRSGIAALFGGGGGGGGIGGLLSGLIGGGGGSPLPSGFTGGGDFGSGAGLSGFKGGGLISGPGSGTSDSILARLSNGEFVVKADAVRRLGTGFLDALNEGRVPGFNGGGLVRSANAAVAGGGGSPDSFRVGGDTYTIAVDARNASNPKEIQAAVRAAVRLALTTVDRKRARGLPASD